MTGREVALVTVLVLFVLVAIRVAFAAARDRVTEMASRWRMAELRRTDPELADWIASKHIRVVTDKQLEIARKWREAERATAELRRLRERPLP